MKVKILLVFYAIITISCNLQTQGDSNNETNSLRQNDLKYVSLAPEIPSASDILPNEIRDSTLRSKRFGMVDLEFISNLILPTQLKGREKLEYDPYQLKVNADVLTSDLLRKFLLNIPRDTMFIFEKINDDWSYKLALWRHIDEILLTDTHKIMKLKSVEKENLRQFELITSWNKEFLLQCGSHKHNPYIKTSNPYVVCASRIILSPDSIRVDMIKFFHPVWPEERHILLKNNP